MKPTDIESKKRKNKGSLSVFDEFADPAGGGSIVFSPALEEKSLQQIENRAKTADLPTDFRSGDTFKTEDKVETQPETKWRQTKDKLETNAGFSELVGLQRDLMIFFYESCKISRTPYTEKLAVEHISSTCETSVSSVKKTIQRLNLKGLLLRKEFKNGRGGWTIYELPIQTYRDMLQSETRDKLKTKWRQSRDKLEPQVETQPETSPPSSSSVLNISNKTTTQAPFDPSWIENLNLDSLQNGGITRSVLLRCRELYPTVTPESLEDLVLRFEVFMKEPKNRVQNARGFFISLAKQLSEGITPLDHIETANDRLLREYTEKAREKKERQAKIEKEALEFEFEAWLEDIHPAKQIELVPESQFAKQGSVPYQIALREHFSQNIWPEKKNKILQGYKNNLIS